MEKKYIYGGKWDDNTFIDFWFVNGGEKFYLFSIGYSKTLYEHFRCQRDVRRLKSEHKWGKNHRIDLLIENRIPYELRKLKSKGVQI